VVRTENDRQMKRDDDRATILKDQKSCCGHGSGMNGNSPQRVDEGRADDVYLRFRHHAREWKSQRNVAKTFGHREVAASVAETLDVKRLEVDGREVRARRHPARFEGRDQVAAFAGRSQADDIDKPG